ncbi:protein MAINTENANCE OF MERISTEMS-like [Cornus florida]|uniref:protein MAINTENANCE OF MERISTEMS-like n=1 Tax=Cornus florida TaxID=4283 RepID=UPI002899C34B|nr:protein MAINTENANCE OF MERISTEMS-like [Cornus florida]
MTEPLEEHSIIEEREALMVSPTGGIPTLITAHFLQPTVAHIDGLPTLKPPSLSSESKWRLNAAFHGWRDPPKKWKSWVDHMHSLHELTWKEVGICEAVIGSMYPIRANNDLVFGIAERWCSETNTFIFPWGEATITLEDMMVLGGFSVLGASVSMPLQAQELVRIEENLNQVRKELIRSKAQKVDHRVWMKHFMQSGSEFEHEAFLSLWLSRFVFPGNVYSTIGKHVFPIAIHLARGTRIALAPPVLASLYRDLSLLKETIVASAELEANANDDSSLAVTLWAPLRLAQCWAWERFSPLRPQPSVIKSGEPRMARWQSLRRSKFENVRGAIDSAGEIFQWRPYVTTVHGLSLPKFYKEKEEWVSNNPSLDEEVESFARCLRVCELVGVDCREQYLPHRVAMQFGMDQDLPGWVPRSNATPEIAWNNYSRPVSDSKLYIPSRLSESDVSTQYLEWWNELFVPQDAVKGIVQRKRSPRMRKRLLQIKKEMKEGNDADVPPGFPPKCKRVEADKHTLDIRSQSLLSWASDDGTSTRTKPKQHIVQGEFATKISETGTEDAHNIDSNKSNEEGSSRDFTFKLPELELEARILRLERVVAVLKAAKFGNKCVK